MFMFPEIPSYTYYKYTIDGKTECIRVNKKYNKNDIAKMLSLDVGTLTKTTKKEYEKFTEQHKGDTL